MDDEESFWQHLTEFHEKSIATTGRENVQLETVYIEKLLTHVTMEQLFSALGKSCIKNDPVYINMTTKSILRILAFIELNDTVLSCILSGLKHDNDRVHLATLRLLDAYFHTTKQCNTTSFKNCPEVIVQLMEFMKSENTTMARIAEDLIVQHFEMTKVFNPVDVENGSVAHLRFLSLYVRLSAIDFQFCVKAGLVQQVVKELNCGDALFVMNLLELLPSIAKMEQGVDHLLHQQGFVQTMLTLCEDPFCGEGAKTCLAWILHHAILYENKYFQTMQNQTIEVFLHMLEPHLENASTSAIEALSILSSSSDFALSLILSNKSILARWIENITHASTNVQSSCISSIMLIMESEWIQDKTLCETLFHQLHHYANYSTSMETLFHLLKVPFPEIRISIFHLFQSIAKLPFGISTLFQHPGFLEFLLNRSSENSKECKEWKFAIVDSILSQKPNLPQTTLSSLQTFFTQGPYLCPNSSEPALDSV